MKNNRIIEIKEELNQLEAETKKCLENFKYERAAQIRDEVRCLTAELNELDNSK